MYGRQNRIQATGRQHRGCIIPQAVNTQSNAPEDGRNHRPKHVEMLGIINKPLLLHLVRCLYYCTFPLLSSCNTCSCFIGNQKQLFFAVRRTCKLVSCLVENTPYFYKKLSDQCLSASSRHSVELHVVMHCLKVTGVKKLVHTVTAVIQVFEVTHFPRKRESMITDPPQTLLFFLPCGPFSIFSFEP